MPQSLTKLYAHLIFSTKNREPFLDDNVRDFLERYNIEYAEQYVWD